jgi:hypothetical protein
VTLDASRLTRWHSYQSAGSQKKVLSLPSCVARTSSSIWERISLSVTVRIAVLFSYRCPLLIEAFRPNELCR